MNGGCTHLDRIHDVTPSSWGCEDCRSPTRPRSTGWLLQWLRISVATQQVSLSFDNKLVREVLCRRS